MASRLLAGRVTYLPNLRAAVKHFRAFSSYNSGEQTGKTLVLEEPSSESVWPDHHLGPLGPTDKRFPFPGRVGPGPHASPKGITLPVGSIDPEVLFKQIPEERHDSVIRQVQDRVEEEESGFMSERGVPTPDDLLECVAMPCPYIMKKDFADLFPGKDILTEELTVITISQKTEGDMTGWNPEVEAEREQLLDSFVNGATEICAALQNEGYWADFIDPSSGKPYHGPHTNATLFETDERYRKLGFEIEDLGCCKVINHHLWGTHSYVGCLFTNAPLNEPILSTMAKV